VQIRVMPTRVLAPETWSSTITARPEMDTWWMTTTPSGRLRRADLPDVLKSAGIDPNQVSLYGSHDNDRVVIDQRAAGWVVFYTERGGEFDLRQRGNEDEACRDVLVRLGISLQTERE
jgi:hypothetical protein